MKIFIRACGLMLFLMGLIVCPVAVSAQPIPALHPPRDEINPTYWELHGNQIMIASAAAVIVMLALIFIFTRPRLGTVESPEVGARRKLTALLGRSHDGTLLMEVSRIFRRYVIFAFNLPPQELTTAELTRSLQPISQSEPVIVSAILDFLRQCDEDKFSAQAMPPRPDAAGTALDLLEKIEVIRHRQLVKQTAA